MFAECGIHEMATGHWCTGRLAQVEGEQVLCVAGWIEQTEVKSLKNSAVTSVDAVATWERDFEAMKCSH